MLNKKIKKLLIGTNNKGKLREISNLLPKNIEIYSTSDFALKSPKEMRDKVFSGGFIAPPPTPEISATNKSIT